MPLPVLSLWSFAALAGVTVTLPATDQEIVVGDDVSEAVELAIGDLASRRFDSAARQLAALADAGGGPHLRYMEAVAHYEAGQLRMADTAAALAITAAGDAVSPGGDPTLAGLMSLAGLIDVDLGRGDRAEARLGAAAALARQVDDQAVLARVELNSGLLLMDRGRLDEALTRLEAAQSMGRDGGFADVERAAADNIAMIGGAAAKDPLGAVSQALHEGDLDAARGLVDGSGEGGSLRDQARRLLADGAVRRATGDLDGASVALTQALSVARGGGLLRESARALGDLGVVMSLGGRHSVAGDRLEEAVGLVAGTSFVVDEAGLRVAAGRVAVIQGELDGASAHLAVVRAATDALDDPRIAAGADELEGLIASRQGEAVRAAEAFGRAADLLEAEGYHADAARVACAAVKASASQGDPSDWVARAQKAFDAVGDPLGASHIAIAEGLGRVAAEDLEGALEAFTRAAAHAEGVGPVGSRVARVAMDNAAQALVALGHDEDAARTDLSDAVSRHERLIAAEAAYQVGLLAYDGGRPDEAVAAFDRAYTELSALGEVAYASQARSARGWASYRAALNKEPGAAYPELRALVVEADGIGEPELAARAAFRAGRAALELDAADAADLLESAADRFERMGLTDEAGEAFAALAEVSGDLQAQAAAARRAAALRSAGDPVATYALYSVAVDAYNGNDFALCLQLVEIIGDERGTLADAIEAVETAAKAAMGG